MTLPLILSLTSKQVLVLFALSTHTKIQTKVRVVCNYRHSAQSIVNFVVNSVSMDAAGYVLRLECEKCR
jgi:hypothetical protein